MKKNTLINSIQIAILMMTGVQAHALPINGTFQNGTGAISPPDGNTLTIDQTSNSAVINWDSFNIGQSSTVTFNTPDAAAATLNIINGNAPSDIKGSLTSNGQLFLFNKNGFLFGANSSVNAAGFMALSSGTNVAYDDGNRTLTLSGNGGGNITTEEGATINAADSGGYIALIAPGINNAATLTANAGSILLTTNNTGTLIVPALSDAIGFNLSGLSGTSSNRLTNSGHITAHNGLVTLSSDALDIITGSAINNSGIIDISIQPGNTSGGVVEINASQGTLIQNGNILATGGKITLQSDNIRITNPVEIIADKVLFKKSTGASGGILNLRADAHITADSAIDLSEFSIIGAGDGVSLTLETNANKSDKPTILLNTIQNVGELTATTEGTLALAGNIQAAG